MWENPTDLWRRLKLGREEYLQRLMTTLILDGVSPPWNTPQRPGRQGLQFLELLDHAAHGEAGSRTAPDWFVDEYLLPRIDDTMDNGWPDWAILWPDRAWIIELKTEAGSHRPAQLPHYLRLAAAAHRSTDIDLTYITGPATYPEPQLGVRQRYRHLTWLEVLPLVEEVWGSDQRDDAAAYAEMVRVVVGNLATVRPSEQRAEVVGAVVTADTAGPSDALLLEMVHATASDGQQRGVGVASPSALETLRDRARGLIDALPDDDHARHVLPWIWSAARSGGRGLTTDGREFGYELRFSLYRTIQIGRVADDLDPREGTS